jgi:cell division protein FtsL
MSSIAQREAIRATRRRGAAGSPSRSERKQARPRLLAGGVFWIVLFGALLAGVVAVNVAVLRLNLELDGVSRERTELRADLANIRAGISSAAATARIEKAARDELGLVQADPDEMIYVTLGPK